MGRLLYVIGIVYQLKIFVFAGSITIIYFPVVE